MSPSKSSKPPSQSASSSLNPESTGLAGLMLYWQGVRAEWHKITWPSWPQVWGQTIVVLVMVSVMTLLLFIMDYFIHTLVYLMVSHRV